MAKRTTRPVPEVREPRHQAARQDLRRPHRAGRSPQRFICRSCRRTFTLPRKAARPRARFADGAIEEAVRLYVQGLPSYRVLSVLLEQRLGRPVGRFTLNGWVDELDLPAEGHGVGLCPVMTTSAPRHPAGRGVGPGGQKGV